LTAQGFQPEAEQPLAENPGIKLQYMLDFGGIFVPAQRETKMMTKS